VAQQPVPQAVQPSSQPSGPQPSGSQPRGPHELVLASRNQGKLVELRRILDAAARGLVILRALPDAAPEPRETGATFEENALIKARSAVAATGRPALADDSGLAVDALHGMPGVLSARWAGARRDDAANLQLLLEQLADVPDERRAGGFVCAAALVTPSGVEHVVVGELRGVIARAPRGSGGFGYDPVLVPDGEHRTTAEMSPGDKDAVSHRGRAFRALAAELPRLLG